MDDWINLVNEIYVMEKMTFSIRLKMTKFVKFWLKWVNYKKSVRPEFVEIQCERVLLT